MNNELIHQINEGVDHLAERNRSYDVRVTRGMKVRALRPILSVKYDEGFVNYRYQIVPTGTILTVFSESNAGFRGIELFTYYHTFHVTVSTGAVEIVRSEEL